MNDAAVASTSTGSQTRSGEDLRRNTAATDDCNGVAVDAALSSQNITIHPYAGEVEMQTIMDLIDGELSEPYTVYTYRYFLNQWPHLCFLAYHTPLGLGTSTATRRPIGVVIGKLDRHLKGQRYMRGYIGMVSIIPSFRGRGVATELLHVLLAHLVRQGAQEVVLETEVDNKASLALYARLGFLREKRLHNFYLNGKDCFRLIAPIPPSSWCRPTTSPQTALARPAPVLQVPSVPPPRPVRRPISPLNPASLADMRLSPSSGQSTTSTNGDRLPQASRMSLPQAGQII